MVRYFENNQFLNKNLVSNKLIRVKLSPGKDCEADLSIFGSYIPSDEWHAHTTTYLFRHARAYFKLRLIFYSRNLSNDILNASFECHRKRDIYNNYVIFEFSETTNVFTWVSGNRKNGHWLRRGRTRFYQFNMADEPLKFEQRALKFETKT